MSYPIFLDLKDKKVVVIGGGRIAHRKIESLRGQGAKILVIAPELNEAILKLSNKEMSIDVIIGVFKERHLDDAVLVFVASSDEKTNDNVTIACKTRSILVNNCMDQTQSVFKSGAVIREGEIEIAIGTGGKRPGVSKWLSERMQSALPQTLDEIVTSYDEIRQEARQKYDRSKDREQYIKESFRKILESLEGHKNEN